MGMNNDIQLIDELRKGNETAFRELYMRHSQACERYANVNVGPMRSPDVVQDVFCQLWLKRKTILPVETLRPYLLRSVYNRSMDLLRHRKSDLDFKNEYARRLEMIAAASCDPDRNEIIRKLFLNDKIETLEKAVCLLPEKCQVIFKMSYYEGMPHKDIARDLGISVSTVDNQVYKALRFLREHLSEEMFMLILSGYFLQFFDTLS